MIRFEPDEAEHGYQGATMKNSLNLTRAEIAASFSSGMWAEKFPPVLTIEQAAGLLQVPVGTIREWRARGRLRKCCRKVGKHLRFYRDRLVEVIFN